MDKKSELETLRNMVDATRQLAHFAIKKLDNKNADLKKRFEVEGRKINSVYWLFAHMTWAESILILRSSGGPNPELPWMKLFALGKPAEEGQDNGPPWEEVYAGFKKVHEMSMAHLAMLNPEDLDSENKLSWEILGGKTMRNTIMHHIRHESNHIGQLLWLVNFHGGRTL
ncbi:MAG: DinB family protein [Bacteroidetes bacterium]|nr:DinB family protein [Bacteroidota bacterium]